MAVQLQFAALLFMHRLARLRTYSQILKLTKRTQEIRTFSGGSVKWNERDDSDSSPLSTKLTSRQALLSGRRRRRPLSPLERISSLMPQDALSPEVMQLIEKSRHEPEEDDQTKLTFAHNVHEDTGCEETPNDDHSDTSDGAAEPATLPGESSLGFGEMLVAEHRKKGQVDFRKMFQLQAGNRLQSSWGIILHDDMAGKPAGRFMKTSRGVPILIRRASLEDYVLFMKRGPAIAYPKDAATMLMMMDVTEGDYVLESGSGSGALSLFLSRAVGSKGRVLSVEVREDHHRRALLNYKRWRTSWGVRRGDEWPDNVQFHNADLCTASSLLADRGFNAVALDLIHPQLVLPTVIPHLHTGAVCAVYLANITQVIDLFEGLRCSALPVLCERIIEVPIRDWVVAPALQKDGRYCTRKAPAMDGEVVSDGNDKEKLTTEERHAFGSIPYIARPQPEQMSHTAFLVKLRKCVQ